MIHRMWINQPSKLQHHHDLHGTNVLVYSEDSKNSNNPIVVVYFLSGDVISQRMFRSALSLGWL